MTHRSWDQYAGSLLLADGGKEARGEQGLGPLAADPAATVPHAVPCCEPGSPVSPVQASGLGGLQHPDVSGDVAFREMPVPRRLVAVLLVHAGGRAFLGLPLGFLPAAFGLPLGVLGGRQLPLQLGPQVGGCRLGSGGRLCPNGVVDGLTGAVQGGTARHGGVVGPLLGRDGFFVGRVHDRLQTGGGTGSAVAHSGHGLVGCRDGEDRGLPGGLETGLRRRVSCRGDLTLDGACGLGHGVFLGVSVVQSAADGASVG
ncbi:hypothetical protein AB0932_07350 [Streptomyces sp. NPDC006682]|uniref:hypothetical protein n=1 Tax=unclassified Streptomyces TaxID=2593676 RepID=UPI00345726A1